MAPPNQKLGYSARPFCDPLRESLRIVWGGSVRKSCRCIVLLFPNVFSLQHVGSDRIVLPRSPPMFVIPALSRRSPEPKQGQVKKTDPLFLWVFAWGKNSWNSALGHFWQRGKMKGCWRVPAFRMAGSYSGEKLCLWMNMCQSVSLLFLNSKRWLEPDIGRALLSDTVLELFCSLKVPNSIFCEWFSGVIEQFCVKIYRMDWSLGLENTKISRGVSDANSYQFSSSPNPLDCKKTISNQSVTWLPPPESYPKIQCLPESQSHSTSHFLRFSHSILDNSKTRHCQKHACSEPSNVSFPPFQNGNYMSIEAPPHHLL